MYYPHSVKKTVTDGKSGKKHEETVRGVRNSLDRDNFIKRFGEERFLKLTETDSYYKKYREPKIPVGCNWIWRHFLDIWNNCNTDFNGYPILSFAEINAYEQCMDIHFSLVEKRLLLKIRNWVLEEISELKS